MANQPWEETPWRRWQVGSKESRRIGKCYCQADPVEAKVEITEGAWDGWTVTCRARRATLASNKIGATKLARWLMQHLSEWRGGRAIG